MNVTDQHLLFDSDVLKALLQDIDNVQLQRDFGVAEPDSIDAGSAVALLRVAAISATTDLLWNFSLDDWLRQGSGFTREFEQHAVQVGILVIGICQDKFQ